MQLSNFDNIRKFYFIGIGGISMSALAKYLLACGCEVSGSDMASGEQTEELISSGVKVRFSIDADMQFFFGFREKLCIIVQVVAQVQHIYNFLFIRPSNA